MGGHRAPWQDGRRAWQRLNGWHQDSCAIPGHGTDKDAAVGALGDVRLVRNLLDQAELNAVRTARSRGATWVEIANALGVTKQAVWDRWHELGAVAAPVS